MQQFKNCRRLWPHLVWVIFSALTLQAQTATLKYRVEYKCGERFTVYYCRSDDQSRDAYPVQPLDDYCKVEYPDRPANPGYVNEGAELRGDIIKKLQACGILRAANPAQTNGTKTSTARDYFEQGQKLFQENKYVEAIEVLKKAIAVDPSYGYAIYYLALSYNGQRQFAETIPLYKQLLAAKWDDVPGGMTRITVMNLLGGSYLLTKQYVDGETIFRQALVRDPKSATALFGLGKSLALQGKTQAAWQVYQTLQTRDKAFAENLKQTIEKQSGGTQQAQASQPSQTENTNNSLAEARKFSAAKDYPKALAAYQNALAAGGNAATLAQVHYEIGQVYWDQKQDEKSAASFREALRLNPNLVDARVMLGVDYYLLGKYPEALKELQETVRARPNDYDTYDWIALTYVALDKKEEAIAAWKKGLAIKPQDARFLVHTGNELEKRKEYDAALGAYLSAVQLKPEAKMMAQAQYGLGSTYNEKENVQAALAPLREAIRLQPNYTEAHTKLAAVYYQLKQYPESIAEYKIAIRLNPDDGWKYYTLGLSYKGAGRKDLAASTWKQILTLKEKDKDMLSLTGSALYDIQEYDLALEADHAALKAPQAGVGADEDSNALFNSSIYADIAEVYFARKQYVEIVKLAESLPVDTPAIFGHELGNAYIALNQLAKAVKVFEETVQSDEEKVAESLYDLGHCYNLMGRKPEARRTYAKLRGIEQAMAMKLLAEINQAK